MLFSTDSKLPSRFINPAPFSKFNLELDGESPGRLGQYIGWQIVRAYANRSDASLKEILNMKGYSCSESILLAALRYLKQPEEYLRSAAPFGGGMAHYDLCGYLTGGLMALGNAAGVHHKDRKKMKALTGKMTKEYWSWWQSWAPLHCYQLRPKYDKDTSVNMKKRVAAKVEELIKKIMAAPITENSKDTKS